MADIEPPANGALGRATILVVEDNAANLRLLVDYLEACALDVVIARDGEQGLDRARRAAPDLIVLDVMMPGVDGFTLCERLNLVGALLSSLGDKEGARAQYERVLRIEEWGIGESERAGDQHDNAEETLRHWWCERSHALFRLLCLHHDAGRADEAAEVSAALEETEATYTEDAKALVATRAGQNTCSQAISHSTSDAAPATHSCMLSPLRLIPRPHAAQHTPGPPRIRPRRRRFALGRANAYHSAALHPPR